MNPSRPPAKSPVQIAQRIVALRARLSVAPLDRERLCNYLKRAEQRLAVFPLRVQSAALAAVDLMHTTARADRLRAAMEPAPKLPRGRPPAHVARAERLRLRRNARRFERLAGVEVRLSSIRAPFAPGELEALISGERAPRPVRPALTRAALADRYDFDPARGVLYRTTARGLRNAVSPRTTTVMVDSWRYPVLQGVGVLLGIAEPLQLRDPTQPPTVSNLLRKPPQ